MIDMAKKCIFIVAVMVLMALANAQLNPCDVHHHDELSGAPQDDPDRPCHIHYDKVTHTKKKRLDFLRKQQQQLEQQQAAAGIPLTTPAPALPTVATDEAAVASGTATGDVVQALAGRAINNNLLLTLHGTGTGADMLVTSTVQALFWGTSWGNGVNAFTGDKITGLSQFYRAHNASRYADTCAEYAGNNGVPTSTTNYLGYVIDTSSTSTLNPDKTSQIGSKVCAKFPNPVANGHYPVFVDKKRGTKGYCGWHSYGYCSGGTYNTNGVGTRITFAFFFNMDTDSGCSVGDTVTGHSKGLANLASVAAHELEEARTDPYCCGYWDANGNENADKCAWTFGRLVTLSDGSKWKLQGEWSNAAYQAGTGYDSNKGCIDGA